ncbi:ATP-dependent ABC transporter [Nadsonia fulvescens var. elongata DSM 6958]|uniref:ATP-dependent ABC transporter n=1 Tax=Nadsonia fulvescens var. elongata DSM 6958 TaxID=857566 RepID=A0A1E3PJ83_9ASCO|nr:ATP-dependent ABC transporter [Nadsonia fulvescens var. elongata DSM 6958]
MATIPTDNLDAFLVPNVDPVDISVRDLNLTVSIKPKKPSFFSYFHTNKQSPSPSINDDKETIVSTDEYGTILFDKDQIIRNVSFDAKPGTLTAIIGGSGSGKTSILNILANTMSSANLSQTGNVYFNGHQNLKKIRSAYVIQQDYLEPNLTARETLLYAAQLRLPSATTKNECRQLVEGVIFELGLKECADTKVGSTTHRGLSGGEKRRLSIGVQLLSNPSVIFLDEPTTGLDAHSAYLLVKTMRFLASKGRTLIMSIHQPRSDIFFLIDNITILTRGQSVYSGPVRNSVSHFERLGFKTPEKVNPADYLIDISSVDNRSPQLESKSSQQVQSLISVWNSSQNLPMVEEKPEPPHHLRDNKTSLRNEIIVLARRSLLCSWRDPMSFAGLFLESIVMGIVVGLVFLQLDGSLTGIRSMQGLLYISTSIQAYLLIIYECYRLCNTDIRIFDREYSEGYVSPLGFVISRRLAKLLTEDLFVPLIFSTLVYFLSGLRTDGAHHFFIYFSINLILHHIAMNFALFSVSLSREFAIASLFGNLCFTFQFISCGYFVNAAQMPVYVRWTKYLAFVWYGFGAYISNQFTGFSGDCPSGDINSDECLLYTGAYILQVLDFPQNWIALPVCVCLAWAIGCLLAALIGLKYIKVNVTVSRRKKSKPEPEVKDELSENLTLSNSNVNGKNIECENANLVASGIDISVHELKLRIQKRDIKLKTKEILILSDISANFKAGSINAILGPSGSGKSSMLNFMAGRLNSSLVSKYASSGEIIFNNAIPSQKVIQSTCSFVTQEDDGLLPSLTVRETLYFAAYLRLPPRMSRSEKRRQADALIARMGLKECSDTMIGSEFIKGISGGEKRRVSICIQLLSKPKIILLDEPTSGLDSFTAASILEVLQSLANEGKTVICTIHQPRSDLFSKFGNVLLLSKGGRVAYNGSSDGALSHFQNIGFPCPALTNPADHIIDLISVNLQSKDKEDISRERVNSLLDLWRTRVNNNSDKRDFSQIKRITLAAELGSFELRSAPWLYALPILLQRSTLGIMRSPDKIMARVMQVAGLGVILALFFSPLKSDYISISNRLGLLQEVTALYFVGMLTNIAVYPFERDVFYREHDDNAYSVLPFFLSYTLLELPFEFISSVLFSTFLVFVIGLPRTPSMFFAMVYSSFCTINCGESIGIIFNTIFHHPGFAVNVISVVLTVGTIMAGIMSPSMPGVFRAINWLSPLKYAIEIVINIGFRGQKFTCDSTSRLPDGGCVLGTGEQVLKTYNLESNLDSVLGGLAAATIIYRLIAYGILKLYRLKLDKDSFKLRTKESNNSF